MSKCQIQQTNHLRTNSTRKSYISESSDDFDEKKTPTTMDNDNSIMKTSQSLDDLLDIDKQNAEDTDETENDDSTQLSMDEPNTTVTKRQKKSNKKKGKL